MIQTKFFFALWFFLQKIIIKFCLKNFGYSNKKLKKIKTCSVYFWLFLLLTISHSHNFEPPKKIYVTQFWHEKLEVQCRETKAVEFFYFTWNNGRSLTSICFLCIINPNSVSSCQTYTLYEGLRYFEGKCGDIFYFRIIKCAE
jgi:hypothetical protein